MIRFLIILVIVLSLGLLATAVVKNSTSSSSQGGIFARAAGSFARVIEAVFVSAFASLLTGALLFWLGSMFDTSVGAAVGPLGGLLLFPVFFLKRVRDLRRATKAEHVSPAVPNQSALITQPPRQAASLANTTAQISFSPVRRWWKSGRGTSSAPSQDQALQDAWETASMEAVGSGSRIAVVRNSCRHLLEAYALDPLDPILIDGAVLIYKQVPALVVTCLDRCRGASSSIREASLEELVESLESIGADADRRTRPSRRAQNDAFQTAREHVANRTARDLFSS